jgi:transposase
MDSLRVRIEARDEANTQEHNNRQNKNFLIKKNTKTLDQTQPSHRSRWAARGIWQQVFEHLARDADNEYAMIDSTIVRAHQHSAGARKKGAANKPSGAAKEA